MGGGDPFEKLKRVSVARQGWDGWGGLRELGVSWVVWVVGSC